MGKDEPVIGKILQDEKIPRSSVFITSKVPAGFGNATDCLEDPSISIRYAKENLRQLGVDYVDLLLLHAPCGIRHPGPHDIAANAALWKGMTEVLAMNLTRAIGVSNYQSTHLKALPSPKPVVNQCQMGVKKHDDETITYCQEKGILYEAYWVMHNCPFTDTRITTIASAHNVSAAQVCQRYVLDKGIAMAVGTGSDPTKAESYAKENLDVYGFHLSADEFKIVDAIQKSEDIVV